jgi:hypothetical protein
MLDHKFAANGSNGEEVAEGRVEMGVGREKASQGLAGKRRSQYKMEEKMVEVRDRLTSIISFINAEIGGKASKVEQKLAYLD